MTRGQTTVARLSFKETGPGRGSSQVRYIWPDLPVPGEDLLLGLQPEGEIHGTVGDDQPGQLVGAPGDLQLQARELIGLNDGNGGEGFEKRHGSGEDRHHTPGLQRCT